MTNKIDKRYQIFINKLKIEVSKETLLGKWKQCNITKKIKKRNLNNQILFFRQAKDSNSIAPSHQLEVYPFRHLIDEYERGR